MRFLRPGDYAVILAYFAILIGIGAAFRKKAAASVEDYFLAGRKMPWWALGLSQMTFWFDMTGTMIIASFLFLLGPRGIYVELRGGAGLVLIFLMLWAGKWHRRSGVITGAEWMLFRFGRDGWAHFARLMSVVSAVVVNLALLAYSFKGAGLFLSMFLPFSPLVCSLIMMLVTALYTIESGFYGVIFSDIFQSVCIWIGVVAIVVVTVGRLAGVADLGALATSVTGNPDWLSPLPQVKTQMPAGYEQYSFLLMMTLLYLGKTLIQGLGVGADPRFFGARSDRDCGRLSFLAGWSFMLRWPLMMSFVVLGLLLVKDLFPDQTVLAQAADLIKTHAGAVPQNEWPELLARVANHPQTFPQELTAGLTQLLGPDWGPKLNLLSFHGTVDPERILPAVLLMSIPAGLRGLLLVAFLAAAMSTFNAIVNGTTAFLTRDLYQGYIRPKAGTKELIYASYGFGALVMLVGFAAAYSTRNINDIWGWLTMGLVGGTMIPTVLRLYWWRYNGSGFALGTLIGMAAALLQRVLIPEMPEWQQLLYMVGAGLAGSVAATYVRPPADRAVLEHFYRTTKPFGLWGPLKRILGAEEAAAMAREHKYDLISVPFALFWQISMLMLPMLLIVRQYGASAVAAGILGLSLVGLYFFWYRKLPD
ncbi:MAG: sodium:solute symporter [Candidatus Aminicenantes bacterium RBG_16_66_30]|nr:MAG: sodium:solute symporter [Candidatus Aminicenantes bacterium RBG_16_66_30]